MKSALSTVRAKLNWKEWDFSPLVKSSINTQRVALEWEIQREHIRQGGKPVLATLGYTAPAHVTMPWLSLGGRLRREAQQRIPVGPVLEIDPQDAVRLCDSDFQDGYLPGARLHQLMVCWDGYSLEQVVGELTSLAGKWRKAERRNHRPRGSTPIAWLWNLSCYRLSVFGGYNYFQIHEILKSRPAFTVRRSAFSPESARKSIEAIEAIVVRPIHQNRPSAGMVGRIVKPTTAGKRVVYKALDGSMRRARVTSKI
jgi:hypothetical protein